MLEIVCVHMTALLEHQKKKRTMLRKTAASCPLILKFTKLGTKSETMMTRYDYFFDKLITTNIVI